MKGRVLLVTFVLSLPFWWAMNAFAEESGNFFYWHKVSNDSYLLSADLKQAILEEELQEIREQRKPRAEEIKIGARAAISISLKGKREKVLFEKNSQEILPIASLTKLMTALVVFNLKDYYDFEDKIVISEKAISQEGKSKFRPLTEGDIFSVKNLVYIMLLESSNDAAYALSEHVGEKAFVGMMNLKKEDIGLGNTFFINPTGLDPDNPRNPRNYSTARDIADLAKYILKNHPEIFEITSLRSFEVADSKGRTLYFIPENTNELIDEFPQIAGGKTGWTPSARGCLLVVMEESNQTYVNVVLGSEKRFEEMREIIRKINGF